jgi:hypothetical protein
MADIQTDIFKQTYDEPLYQYVSFGSNCSIAYNLHLYKENIYNLYLNFRNVEQENFILLTGLTHLILGKNFSPHYIKKDALPKSLRYITFGNETKQLK